MANPVEEMSEHLDAKQAATLSRMINIGIVLSRSGVPIEDHTPSAVSAEIQNIFHELLPADRTKKATRSTNPHDHILNKEEAHDLIARALQWQKIHDQHSQHTIDPGRARSGPRKSGYANSKELIALMIKSGSVDPALSPLLHRTLKAHKIIK